MQLFTFMHNQQNQQLKQREPFINHTSTLTQAYTTIIATTNLNNYNNINNNNNNNKNHNNMKNHLPKLEG